jgi:hypothetical protein
MLIGATLDELTRGVIIITPWPVAPVMMVILCRGTPGDVLQARYRRPVGRIKKACRRIVHGRYEVLVEAIRRAVVGQGRVDRVGPLHQLGRHVVQEGLPLLAHHETVAQQLLAPRSAAMKEAFPANPNLVDLHDDLQRVVVPTTDGMGNLQRQPHLGERVRAADEHLLKVDAGEEVVQPLARRTPAGRDKRSARS